MSFKTRLKTIVPGLAALACALAPASADAYSQPLKIGLAVEITGIHVVDWTYRTDGFPAADRYWTNGAGTQTMGISTPRPLRLTALTLPREAGQGPIMLLPFAYRDTLRAVVRRRGSWKANAPAECDREGGCDGSDLQQTKTYPPTTGCGPKRFKASPEIDVARDGGRRDLRLLLDLPFRDLFPDCAPSQRAQAPPYFRPVGPLPIFATASETPVLTLRRAAERIKRLRRGRTLTIKASQEYGSVGVNPPSGLPCRKRPAFGTSECATLDVTVEIKRVR